MKNVDIQPAEHIEYPKCTQTDESHLQQLIKGKIYQLWQLGYYSVYLYTVTIWSF